MSFRMPPLVLRVASLQGVPAWRDAHPKGFLLPEDVRRDALYQALARRNRSLRKALGLVALIVLLALGVVAGMWGMRAAVPSAAVVAASTPALIPPAAPQVHTPPVAPPQTSASSPVVLPIAIARLVPAIVQPAVPGRGTHHAAEPRSAALVVRPPTARAVATSATASATQARLGGASTPRHDPVDTRSVETADWPVAPAAAPREAGEISITDFFGVNTAAMLSSNGGRTVRTYRVGDALPDGEVITSIDTNRGTVTTNRRTIKK